MQPTAQMRLFAERLPYRPRAADETGPGLRRFSRAEARSKRFIEYDPPAWRGHLVFDIDRKNASGAWLDAELPPPTWVAQNPANGHCHTGYSLEVPVLRTKAGRLAPLRLAAAVDIAYRTALRADLGYACFLTKNPEHPAWRVLYPGGYWYGLEELAEYVDLSFAKGRRRLPEYGIGRNVTLFERLRGWAYAGVRDYWALGGYEAWTSAVLAKAEGYNDFAVPLPYSEVRSTARSIAKWVWQRFTPAGFSAVQSARGRKKGRKRKAELLPRVRALHAQGQSQQAIAQALGITQQTISNWLQKAISDISGSPMQASRGRKKGQTRKEELLPRVLELRAQGKSQRAIAVALNIPRKTIAGWLK